MITIPFITAFLLLLFSFVIKTYNDFASRFVFKFIPFLLGLTNLIYGLFEVGVLKV